MLELVKKELKAFFCSLSGYVVLFFFLITTGLFLWVIPNQYNIPESGMADMQPFFSLAPMLYLFLVPVLCMRLFAEEKRMGTLELLFTRPVSVWRIVAAKYLAGYILVLFSILPTLVYPVTLYCLSQPVGNIDTGGIIGSYIGLLFLSGIYVAIGVWTSALTDNQIVAFLYAMVLSFLLLTGLDMVSELPALADMQGRIQMWGIDYHYEPMSRGVITLSDVFYFLSFIVFFLWLTVRRFRRCGFRTIYAVVLLLGLNMLISHVYVRADITNDKRYTLSDNTRELLTGLDKQVRVDLFLAGKLPPGMQKLQYATTRMLDEFSRLTGGDIRYSIIDPGEVTDKEEKVAMVKYLSERGIMPVNLNRKSADETLSQQIIFPGMLVYDDSTEVCVSLLQNIPGYTANDNINHSVEALEYELTKALRLLTGKERKSVGFLVGHGELPYPEVMDIARTLSYYYHVDFVSSDSLADDLSRYEVLVIAKPTQDFPERDKYIIDQYVMRGGRVLWCVDEVEVDHDALKERETTFAVYHPLNIEDMLFKYGVRINPDLLLDGNCVLVPVVTGMNGTQPEYSPGAWYYSPLLVPQGQHPVTAGIQPVRMDYANSIDTVGGKDGLKKTVLLSTSRYTAALKTPCPVSLSITEEKMTEKMFNQRYKPVAVMIEGQFESLYRYNRRTDGAVQGAFRPQSDYSRMIVVGDGDVLRNNVRGIGKNATAVPLGYDEFSGQMYGNRDFILNCVNMLCDDEGWMVLRGRNLSLYLLDRTRWKSEQGYWEFMNLMLPLLIVIAGGGIVYLVRRKRFT